MNIIPFDYSGRQIRIVKDDGGVPWWVAADVCSVLEIADTSQALERLDGDEKLMRKIYASGQTRDMWMVSESGLYDLIIRSNKPEAKQFRRWITHEVLPAIRETGYYDTGAVTERISLLENRLSSVVNKLAEFMIHKKPVPLNPRRKERQLLLSTGEIIPYRTRRYSRGVCPLLERHRADFEMLLTEGYSGREIAALLGVHHSSVCRWIKKMETGGEYEKT